MGFHSDDEPELGEQPIIASLSLGAERTFIFKHKTAKTLKPFRIKLGSGSLLLMKGETQQNWKHGIEKEASSMRATGQLNLPGHSKQTYLSLTLILGTKKKAYGLSRKPLTLWWVWLDSNQRPRDYESPALTD